MQITNMSNIIRKECRSITNKLSNDFEKFRMHKLISSELKHEWITQQLLDKQTSSTIIRLAFWTNSMRFDFDAIHFNNQRKRKINRFHIDRWKKKWTEYAFFVFVSISIQIDFVDKKSFKLHDQLKKIENFLTIQIRIEKIDFASFLYRRKILDVKSIFCRYD
jgi:nanoRNase/pAp phosphatase (c-di-AMP/oligoRNAs hydrolase)